MVDLNSFIGGAAASTAIQIVIQAQDQYSSEFKRAEKQVGVSTKKMTANLLAVSAASLAVGAAMVSLARESAKTQAVHASFDRILGDDSTYALERLRDATRGTVSDFELMARANIFFQNISSATPQQLAKIAEAAGPLARAVGITVPEAYERLVQGIAKGETELLDELGLKLDATVANRRYAESIGKSVADLTAQERATAALVNILPQLEEHLKRLGHLQDDANTSSERLAASWKNLRDQTGQTLGPGLTSAFNLTSNVLESMRGDPREGLNNEQYLRVTIRAQEEMAKNGKSFYDNLKEQVSLMKQSNDVLFKSSALYLQMTDHGLKATEQQRQQVSFSNINYNLANLQAIAEANKLKQQAEQLLLQAGITQYTQEQLDNLVRQMEVGNKLVSIYDKLREGSSYLKGKSDEEIEQIRSGKKPIGSNITLKPRQNDFVMRGETLVPFSQQDTIIGFKGNKVPGGATFVFNDMTVQGLDADAVAEAIQRKLSRALTI